MQRNRDDSLDDEADDDSVAHEPLNEDDFDLVQCPYCGLYISELAEVCPKCKSFISREDVPRPPKPWWWIVIVFVLIATMIGFGVLF